MKFFKYFVLLLLFSGVFVSAQSFRFKTSTISILEKDRYGKWKKWSTPKPTEVIVTLDYDKNKIVIYSTEIQYYKIVEYLGKEISETDEINSYLCKNPKGIAVKISFFVRKDKNNKTQLYVYNKDFSFCYDIEEITE